mmetsp:Transcript_13889/g.37081  ORF Transcript_13889/g.37081 Transcript_13889/m.37081 type:complete len:100 (-) Transcript_13889:659-958(-)
MVLRSMAGEILIRLCADVRNGLPDKPTLDPYRPHGNLLQAAVNFELTAAGLHQSDRVAAVMQRDATTHPGTCQCNRCLLPRKNCSRCSGGQKTTTIELP